MAAAIQAEPEELQAILGEEGFDELVAHYRALLALPAEERLAKLVERCWQVLVWAAEDHDLMAACFVLHHRRAGRCPARRLAQRVLCQVEPEGHPPPLAAPSP